MKCLRLQGWFLLLLLFMLNSSAQAASISRVVNDSLILVNLVNQLKHLHPRTSMQQRIIPASGERLRPIVLTPIITVAGLLPMAYGLGDFDLFSAPTALAMGYGILFATPITLILIPCLLAILNDLSPLLQRISTTRNHQPETRS